jgi:hypothetical protein
MARKLKRNNEGYSALAMSARHERSLKINFSDGTFPPLMTKSPILAQSAFIDHASTLLDRRTFGQ